MEEAKRRNDVDLIAVLSDAGPLTEGPATRLLHMLEGWYLKLKTLEVNGQVAVQGVSSADVLKLFVNATSFIRRDLPVSDPAMERELVWTFIRQNVMPVLCGLEFEDN